MSSNSYRSNWSDDTLVDDVTDALKRGLILIRVKKNKYWLTSDPVLWPSLVPSTTQKDKQKEQLEKGFKRWLKAKFPSYDYSFSNFMQCMQLLGLTKDEILQLNTVTPNDMKIFGVLEFEDDNTVLPSLGDEHKAVHTPEESIYALQRNKKYAPVFFKLYIPKAVKFVNELMKAGRKIKFLLDNSGRYDCLGGRLTVEEVAILPNGDLVGFHREVIEELGLIGCEINKKDSKQSFDEVNSEKEIPSTVNSLDLSGEEVVRSFVKEGISITLTFLKSPSVGIPYIVKVKSDY